MRKIVRIVVLLLVIILAVGAVGCGDKKPKIPEGMNESVYNYGVRAVEIADEFLDFKITKSEAEQKFKDLQTMEDNLPNSQGENAVSERALRSRVISNTSILYSGIRGFYDNVDLDAVKANRNKLAKLLGLKER